MTRQRKRIEKYITSEYGISPDHPWHEYPNYAVFRNANNRKWFGLVMNVPAYRLGMDGDAILDVINIHCPIDIVATILPDGTFAPGYHMNKASWTTIILDGRLDDGQIIPLIDESFKSVMPRTRRTPSKHGNTLPHK